MSEKERALVEQLAKLPADVQDQFLLMAQGAAVAVECSRLADSAERKSDEHDAERDQKHG